MNRRAFLARQAMVWTGLLWIPRAAGQLVAVRGVQRKPVSSGGTTEVNASVSSNDRDGFSYGAPTELMSWIDNISYIGNPDGNVEQFGCQFQLNIAQGKTIAEAYLTVYVSASFGTPSGNSVTVKVYDVDTSTVYVDFHSHAIDAHQTVSGTTVTGWTAAWAATNSYTSPDLKALIQIPISRAGWVANNYLGLALVPVSWDSGDEIGLYDRAGGTANVASLRVVYNT